MRSFDNFKVEMMRNCFYFKTTLFSDIPNLEHHSYLVDFYVKYWEFTHDSSILPVLPNVTPIAIY